MQRLFPLFLLLLLSVPGRGQDPSRHQVRLGWGDMLFETIAFHPSSTHRYPAAPQMDYPLAEKRDLGYTGHIFAEYRYQFTPLVSIGMLADFQGIFWTTETHFRSRNYDLTLLPNVRFSYFNREWVRLYSGLGAGLTVAFDNERHAEFAPALNLNFLGVQVGKGHWSGSAELGFMAALSDASRVYMLGSRLLSVSVNYCW
ncbi:MAG: hypothetical protein IJV37_07920 [Bacteroidales bacterium]|nr:hypothetical protein [Bacteroidales bacterium]